MFSQYDPATKFSPDLKNELKQMLFTFNHALKLFSREAFPFIPTGFGVLARWFSFQWIVCTFGTFQQIWSCIIRIELGVVQILRVIPLHDVSYLCVFEEKPEIGS